MIAGLSARYVLSSFSQKFMANISHEVDSAYFAWTSGYSDLSFSLTQIKTKSDVNIFCLVNRQAMFLRWVYVFSFQVFCNNCYLLIQTSSVNDHSLFSALIEDKFITKKNETVTIFFVFGGPLLKTLMCCILKKENI